MLSQRPSPRGKPHSFPFVFPLSHEFAHTFLAHPPKHQWNLSPQKGTDRRNGQAVGGEGPFSSKAGPLQVSGGASARRGAGCALRRA